MINIFKRIDQLEKQVKQLKLDTRVPVYGSSILYPDHYISASDAIQKTMNILDFKIEYDSGRKPTDNVVKVRREKK
jgi:hypothetical protein